MSTARRWSLVGFSVLIVLVLDQLTKWWAVERLQGSTPIELFWTLQFQYAENTGMAFSRGAGLGRYIGLFALVIVGVLLFAARRMRSPVQLVLVGVVVGGALGNIVDRVARARDGFLSGAVVDFIDVQWWPIFNIADAAVVVGGILLAITSLREPDDRADGQADDPVGGPADAPARGPADDEADRSLSGETAPE